MLTIEVIGYKGVVGNATYQWLKAMYGCDEEILIAGKDLFDRTNTPEDYYVESSKDEIVCFVCVPEIVIEQVCKEAAEYADWLVIRSTVTPGTCDKISNIINKPVCHVPEFLREASAVYDEFNQEFYLIGACCDPHADFLFNLFKCACRPMYETDTKTSELTKLAMNCYLSCQISFWNEIENIARRIGCSGHEIGTIASKDPRISTYGARLHNKFNGKCLPKDMLQLTNFAKIMGLEPKLLEAVTEVNEQCLTLSSPSRPITKSKA